MSAQPITPASRPKAIQEPSTSHWPLVAASGKYAIERSRVEEAPGTIIWPIAPHAPGRNTLGMLAPEIGLPMNMVMTAPTPRPTIGAVRALTPTMKEAVAR